MPQTAETLTLLVLAIPVYLLAHLLTIYLETGRLPISWRKPDQVKLAPIIRHEFTYTSNWNEQRFQRIDRADLLANNEKFECKVLTGRNLS